MDGRTAHIREALDAAGHDRVVRDELQHEVRQPVLWAVPGRGRLGAAIRRSPPLSDRRAGEARCDRVERALRRRRRRPADGQAGHDVDRSHPADRRGHREAGRRLSGERRVRESPGARRAGLRGFRRGLPRDAGTYSAAPAPPTSSPTARVMRARSDWPSRASGALRSRARHRTRRRAQPGPRISAASAERPCFFHRPSGARLTDVDGRHLHRLLP